MVSLFILKIITVHGTHSSPADTHNNSHHPDNCVLGDENHKDSNHDWNFGRNNFRCLEIGIFSTIWIWFLNFST